MTLLINRLKQPRAKSAMHLQARVDDLPRNRVCTQRRVLAPLALLAFLFEFIGHENQQTYSSDTAAISGAFGFFIPITWYPQST